MMLDSSHVGFAFNTLSPAVGIVLCAVSAYLCGSIPFGFLIGKLNGVDIRTVGSHNIGATNLTRTLGKRWGWPCFLLDFSKGALPVLLALHVTFSGESVPYLASLCALCAIFGHVFPLWLKFKGGKGVSTLIGALLVLAPYAVLAGVVVWCIVFFISKYVSLASIVMMILLPLLFYLTADTVDNAAFKYEMILFIAVAVAGVIKHRNNIQRLINGTEYAFGTRKTEEQK